MTDPFAYLLDAGLPLDVIERHRRDGLSYEQQAQAVASMISRGESLDEIIGEETGEAVPEETPKPSLSTISAADLEKKTIPPITWIAEGLLPTGLTIWASPPKLGKSWLALLLCLSATVGGTFLGFVCCQCQVLYLALEDSERRLKDRLQKVLGPVPPPDNLHFTTQAPTLDTGLVDALETHIKQYPQTQLVIVDTLQKVRDVGSGRDVYGRDYADVGALKKFADSHNICVVLVHHLRKMGDDSDPFNRISGTNGISGAADSMWVLYKEKRGDETATLNIVGRDVEERKLVLRFNKQSFVWENMGDADEIAAQQAQSSYQNDTTVRTIREILKRRPEGWEGSAKDLMGAGQIVTNTALANSSRELSNKLKTLCGPLLEHDNIMYTYRSNGTGGGRHRFTYADDPQFEEVETADNPFSDG